MATIMPVAVIIEPIDRSNSPEIMSSATGTARMPSSAAGVSQLPIPSLE